MSKTIKTPMKSVCPTPSTSPSGGGKGTSTEAGYPSQSKSSASPPQVIYDNGVLRK